MAGAPLGEIIDRVFTYLASHPDGTGLTELEEEFGLSRIQVVKVLHTLADAQKIEKRDQLYFAI